MCTPVSGSGALGWGVQSEESSLGPTLLRGNLLQPRCLSLWHLSHCPAVVAVPALFPLSPFLPALCHLLQILGYGVSLQLVFSWFFRVIALQFSCISSLVLGRGIFKIHLLCCHLETPGMKLLISKILLWKS